MTIERATYEAGLEVFNNLREEDAWEISALGGRDAVLSELVDTPGSRVARVEGTPACLFGTVSGRGLEPARLWLVTTPLVEKKWVHLARMGYDYVQVQLRKHGVLECFVLCRNERSDRWLRWMGFTGTPIELNLVGSAIRYIKRL